LWDTVEAFGGSPGVHKGLVTTLLAEPLQVADHNKITNKERAEAKEEVAEL
jgi:hypothetical protein